MSKDDWLFQDRLPCLAGDHLGVMPDNMSHLSEKQLIDFATQLGIANLDDAFDLEPCQQEQGDMTWQKPFPLPQTCGCILSGATCSTGHCMGTRQLQHSCVRSP